MGRNMGGVPQQRGLTLVELVVTIAIAAILMAIAMPSFSTFLVNSRIKNAAGRLQQDLQWARAEAIKENQVVTVNLTGTLSAAAPACSWAVIAPASSQAPQENQAAFQRDYPQVGCKVSGSTLCFSPIGNLLGGGVCNFGGTYTYADPSTPATNTWLVIVSAGGRILSCLQSNTPGQCQ
ncbi:MAG: GspH/FimT family pseudopilin [Acidithiobacillus sp.]